MQSRIEFLQQSIQALSSAENQIAQLKAELEDLNEDCIRLANYAIETNPEVDRRIIEVMAVLDELVDTFDNILAKPGDDIKKQRETDYRYSVRFDAKSVKQCLEEHELSSV
ncbi:MAG: hypothetical protein K2X27_06305 [Candidatus Obscuribacterales bacterium]|nr:hypothetical protein [Candidatus Obscuribacterales bacterium]